MIKELIKAGTTVTIFFLNGENVNNGKITEEKDGLLRFVSQHQEVIIPITSVRGIEITRRIKPND